MEQMNLAKLFLIIQAIVVVACLALFFLSRDTSVFGDGFLKNFSFWAILGIMVLSISFVLTLYVTCANMIDMTESGLKFLFFITLIGPLVIVAGWFITVDQINKTHSTDTGLTLLSVLFLPVFLGSVIGGTLLTLIGSFFFEWGLSRQLKEKM